MADRNQTGYDRIYLGRASEQELKDNKDKIRSNEVVIAKDSHRAFHKGEDGNLNKIVSNYTFDTIADLQNADYLVEGDIVEVLGYYEKGDGAGHKRIVSILDNGTGIEISSGLFVNLLGLGQLDVRLLGAKGDGTKDDTASFQKLATLVEDKYIRTFTIPNSIEEYLITDAIKFTNPGVRIHGNQGPSYNRLNKLGWIKSNVGDGNCTIDLGNSRTTGNPADNWQVEYLSIKSSELAQNSRTQDAIRLTTRTNGPDRGLTVDSFSCHGMNSAINIVNPDLETVLANLTVKDCCFNANNYCVLTTGNTIGMDFKNNQAEQNALGCIKGTFTSAVTIEQNMLEGQPNTVEIEIPPVTGNRPQVTFKNNYLEQNRGDFVIKASSSSSLSRIAIGPNFIYNLKTEDYAVITGDWLIEMKDREPITFSGSGVARYGSKLFNDGTNYYYVKDINPSSPFKVFTAELNSLLFNSENGDYSETIIYSQMVDVRSPYGMIKSLTTPNAWVKTTLSVKAGDTVTVCVFGSFYDPAYETTAVQIYDSSRTKVVNESGIFYDFTRTAGNWTVLSFTFVASVDSEDLFFRIYMAKSPIKTKIKIAGFGALNHGVTNEKVRVTPCIPNFFDAD